MKKNCSTFLVIVLVLIIANTGFARAEEQLCRTSCEYSAVNSEAHSPCCASSKAADPVMVMAGHDETTPADCPHVGSDREIPDPLTFIAGATTLPVPPQAAVFAAVFTPMPEVPESGFSGYALRAGLSPPGWNSPPAYRLNCSLLI